MAVLPTGATNTGIERGTPRNDVVVTTFDTSFMIDGTRARRSRAALLRSAVAPSPAPEKVQAYAAGSITSLARAITREMVLTSASGMFDDVTRTPPA